MTLVEIIDEDGTLISHVPDGDTKDQVLRRIERCAGVLEDKEGLALLPEDNVSAQKGPYKYKYSGHAPPNPPAYDFQQLHQFLSVAPEILREMGISRRTRLDPWERESLRTTGSKRSAKFRSKIIRYYDRMSQTGKSVKCQVLDEDVAVSAATNNNTGIIAAHIWKASTLGHGLEEFGLQPSDVNNPRNGLFLTKGLEVAFDRKQICFLYNHIDHKLILWVADTSLMLEVIVGSGRNQTFSDVHQKPLICPHGKLPYRRLLSWHARLTLDQCRQTIDTTRYVSEYDNSPGRQNTVVDPFTRAIQAMVGPGDDASTLDDEMQS